ncbi:hypothetical protein B0I35DRAFT_168798 [Stachybotrys elegans]|uniref:Uncharacterized protein n=1 Tax=Stachybotrys elegans TaxID=80388 RepID=A0A8K0T236_9HYPO|nr:hypothetical protein B0I35DRAFT_168798 [Stachybotrys elegans]
MRGPAPLRPWPRLLRTEYYDCTGPETNRQYCAWIQGYAGVTCDGFFTEYVRVDGQHSWQSVTQLLSSLFGDILPSRVGGKGFPSSKAVSKFPSNIKTNSILRNVIVSFMKTPFHLSLSPSLPSSGNPRSNSQGT